MRSGINKGLCCRLTDENGMVLNPYDEHAICYTELTLPFCRRDVEQSSLPKKAYKVQLADILISFYLSIFKDGKCLSEPIPFHLCKEICIVAPECAVLSFETFQFFCCAVPDDLCGAHSRNRMKLCVQLGTVVRGRSPSTQQITDCFMVQTLVCCFHLLKPLDAEVYHYNAIAKEHQRIFRNEDELTEYSNRGILSPEDVSYYQLLINGVLQPKCSYRLQEGILELQTTDVPAPGVPVILVFVTLKGQQNFRVINFSYFAISDGTKRVFHNCDEIITAHSIGIPDPDEVSFYSLYINGVLQPKINYQFKKGLLALTTTDTPLEGSVIIFDSIVVAGQNHILRWGEANQYTARSKGEPCFTDRDELFCYGSWGIHPEKSCSYQFLSLNGALQPQVNYQLQEGSLTLTTETAPSNGAPVTLQYIDIY